MPYQQHQQHQNQPFSPQQQQQQQQQQQYSPQQAHHQQHQSPYVVVEAPKGDFLVKPQGRKGLKNSKLKLEPSSSSMARRSDQPSSRAPLSPYLSPTDIVEATRGKLVLLVPCTFEDELEASAARLLIPLLKEEASPARVLMVQLFLPGMGPGPDTNELLLRKHEAMLASSPHAVLVNPPTDPRSLCDAVEIHCAVDEQSERRMQGALDAEVPAVSQEEINTLRQEQERLLWNEIPSVLMQQLPHANPALEEKLNAVGDFKFVRRLAARTGAVFEAVKASTPDHFAVKVIEKDLVTSPGLLEGYYRELILLSRTLDHPGISRCLEVLHSPTKLYYVFRFAGGQNLAQVLEGRERWQLPPSEARECFGQVATAVAYCHDRNVALRDFATEHVVLDDRQEDPVPHWTLVDFRSSLITQGNNTSSVLCGSFPCMAPEVASGQNYVPRMADRWSMGILLLEITAGLGTLEALVQWVGAAVDVALAARVTGFFRDVKAIQKAFATRETPLEDWVRIQLQSLLRISPEERAEPGQVLRGLDLPQPPVPMMAAG